MKLEHEFYRLPLRFDVDRLKAELSRFDENDWRPHPDSYGGNWSIPLISVNGELNDEFAGEMQMTEYLQKSPYLQQVIGSFRSVFGRSRLMRLDGKQEVPLHCDSNYHWFSRVRIHVPIFTTSDVIFHCADQRVHMAAGESWIFDAWKPHRVVNGSGEDRVHLVIDTTGSPMFWDLTKKADVYSSASADVTQVEPMLIGYNDGATEALRLERFNIPVVMSPGEVDLLVEDLIQDARSVASNRASELANFIDVANFFRRVWRSTWSMHGSERQGWETYAKLLAHTRAGLQRTVELKVSNGERAWFVMDRRVLDAAFNPNLALGGSTA